MIDTTTFWNDLLDRCSSTGIDSLSPAERAINRVNVYLIEIEGGGLSGLLYNLSPDASSAQNRWNELRATADALLSVGEPECASVLGSVASALESPIGVSPTTWAEHLSRSFPGRALAEHEAILQSRAPSAWDTLQEFTVAHLSRNSAA